jgi:hypothetical protein
VAGAALGAPVESVLSLAKKEKQQFLETLKELVSIENGSREIEGLNRLSSLIAGTGHSANRNAQRPSSAAVLTGCFGNGGSIHKFGWSL